MDNSQKGLVDSMTKLSMDLHKNLSSMIEVFDQMNDLAGEQSEKLSEEQREKFRNFVKGAGLDDLLKKAQEKVNK